MTIQKNSSSSFCNFGPKITTGDWPDWRYGPYHLETIWAFGQWQTTSITIAIGCKLLTYYEFRSFLVYSISLLVYYWKKCQIDFKSMFNRPSKDCEKWIWKKLKKVLKWLKNVFFQYIYLIALYLTFLTLKSMKNRWSRFSHRIKWRRCQYFFAMGWPFSDN